jgi:hypothetical protein
VCVCVYVCVTLVRPWSGTTVYTAVVHFRNVRGVTIDDRPSKHPLNPSCVTSMTLVNYNTPVAMVALFIHNDLPVGMVALFIHNDLPVAMVALFTHNDLFSSSLANLTILFISLVQLL